MRLVGGAWLRLVLMVLLAGSMQACNKEEGSKTSSGVAQSQPPVTQTPSASAPQGKSLQAGLDGASPIPLAMRGATVLQTAEVKLDSALSKESMGSLRQLGANTVVLVPFMRQDSPRSDHVDVSGSVTDEQLGAGIRAAHALGMKVIVKPQILVGGGGWAGVVNPGSSQGWDRWFASYKRILLHYAEMAEQSQVELFVVGTELKQSDKLPHWRGIIAAVREVYKGNITYAAHNLDGIENYAHWELLDQVGVTLYPPLGSMATRAAMQPVIQRATAGLLAVHERLGKPVLVTEVGIPSIHGAQSQPWDYSKKRCDAASAPELQATVLDLWLEALNQSWVSGVLVWNWYSDPYAGGRFDTDYTVQHKPAEAVLRRRWGGRPA